MHAKGGGVPPDWQVISNMTPDESTRAGDTSEGASLVPVYTPPGDYMETLLSRSPGAMLVAAALALTTLLWIGAKVEVGSDLPLWPWRASAQLSINWALTLMALALVSASRSPAVEPMFGGLDRAVRLHRILGPTAIVLLVLHIVFLSCLYWAEKRALPDLFIPFRNNWIFDSFILITYGFFVLGLLAYAARIAYERWRLIHALNGLLFIPSILISLFMESSISSFEPFRLWMGLLAFVGMASLFHRFVVFRRSRPQHVYRVSRIQPRGADAYDLVLDPVAQRMSYAPGKFVFLSISEGRRWSRDLHPFSLSSSPVRRELRLSIREVGDFTHKLRHLPIGHPVRLYGPYGSFTLHSVASFQHILCIGAGIGIAPFLGMLEFERTNNEQRRISLVYAVRERSVAAYHAEITSAVAALDNVDYRLWVSSETGRLSVSVLASLLEAPQTTAVMLCGPEKLLTNLIKQLRGLGVPRENIYAEGFAFR